MLFLPDSLLDSTVATASLNSTRDLTTVSRSNGVIAICKYNLQSIIRGE